MGDFFKGETITIKRKVYNGVDEGNNPIEEWVEQEVEDVLVSFKSTSTNETVEVPVEISTDVTLRFKPSVVLNVDDVYVVRGTEWQQNGLPVQPYPSGFRGNNNFLVNKRTTVKVKQVEGQG